MKKISNKTKISDKTKIFVVLILILGIAIIKDLTLEGIENGEISRGEIGDKEQELLLKLNVENIVEDYDYLLKVSSMLPTKEEAEDYFSRTIEDIDKDFEAPVTEISLKSTYFDGIVKAEWSFEPFGIIDSNGIINTEKLEEEETIIQAKVNLRCGTYEKIYEFSFLVKKPELSEGELLLEQIEEEVNRQMEIEGTEKLKLPSELNGYRLSWSEDREYLTPQILLLEIVSIVLFVVFSKRKKQEDEKKKLQDMEKDYADIVSQLSLLYGAGMTTKQAWNRIAVQYNFKRNAQMIAQRPVYEAILRMNGRFLEGVSERVAYQQFREEIPASCYYKLMRILLGSMEKGTQGLSIRLEEESRLAFEQKILQAKKRGEEASTKMLGPLMFMFVIVMGIIMIPALMSFQV